MSTCPNFTSFDGGSLYELWSLFIEVNKATLKKTAGACYVPDFFPVAADAEQASPSTTSRQKEAVFAVIEIILRRPC